MGEIKTFKENKRKRKELEKMRENEKQWQNIRKNGKKMRELERLRETAKEWEKTKERA